MKAYQPTTYYPSASKSIVHPSLLQRFFNWCVGQEKNRLGWVAAIIAIHGCVLTPITMFAVVSAGMGFIYIPFISAAIALPLISNLAAMPTKITLPLFFSSILVDLVILFICIYQLMH